MGKLRIRPVGLALGFLFAISFTLCVAYGLIVPTAWQMHPIWLRLLPTGAWAQTFKAESI